MGGFGYALGDFLRRQGERAQGVVGSVRQAGFDAGARMGAGPSLFNDLRAGLQGAPAYGQDVELAAAPLQAPSVLARESLIPSSDLPIERAINRPSADNLAGLRAGQFQARPGFNSGIGGAGATANQLAVDTNARALLENKYALEDEANEAAEARRGDPMVNAIQGQAKNLAYEGLLPYGSTSRIGASFGSGWGDLSGSEVGSEVVGERAIGGPTVGEAKSQQQAEVNSLFRNAPQLRELEMRAGVMQQLQKLRAMADAAIAAGKDPAATEQEYSRQEKMLLLNLTAAAGKDLGLFEYGSGS